MSNNIWYTRKTRNATAATRRMFAKMRRDGFPLISMQTWGITHPNDMNKKEMTEWAKEARIECWDEGCAPKSAKAVLSMIARITTCTDMSKYNMSGNFGSAQDTMLAMRIAAIKCGMMTEAAADEYMEINIPA